MTPSRLIEWNCIQISERPVQQQRSGKQKNTQWQKLQSKLSEEFPADFSASTRNVAIPSPVFYLYKKWMEAAAVSKYYIIHYIFLKNDKVQTL